MLDKLLYDDKNGSHLSIPEKRLLDFLILSIKMGLHHRLFSLYKVFKPALCHFLI